MSRRLPLTIAGVDFTEAASRREYTITYEERAGQNAGMMLNGDMELDILTRRPVITWPLNALWLDELAALQQAIYTADYVQVEYLDTRQADATPTTGYFHGSISEQKVGLISERGIMFHGPILTLRSR